MFNSSLTFGEENLGVEERKGKKRNENGKISPIFSIFLRNSPIFSRNDRKNDRKRPEMTGNDRRISLRFCHLRE